MCPNPESGKSTPIRSGQHVGKMCPNSESGKKRPNLKWAAWAQAQWAVACEKNISWFREWLVCGKHVSWSGVTVARCNYGPWTSQLPRPQNFGLHCNVSSGYTQVTSQYGYRDWCDSDLSQGAIIGICPGKSPCTLLCCHSLFIVLLLQVADSVSEPVSSSSRLSVLLDLGFKHNISF